MIFVVHIVLLLYVVVNKGFAFFVVHIVRGWIWNEGGDCEKQTTVDEGSLSSISTLHATRRSNMHSSNRYWKVTWTGKLEQQRCLHVCMHYKSYTEKLIHVLTTNELHGPARISECHVMCAAVAASLKLSPACNKFAMCTASSKPCVRTRNSQRACVICGPACVHFFQRAHVWPCMHFHIHHTTYPLLLMFCAAQLCCCWFFDRIACRATWSLH